MPSLLSLELVEIMAWLKGRPSNKAVNRAGDVLRDYNGPLAVYEEALEVVEWWRNAHFMPVYQLMMRARALGAAVDPKSFVANRTKRMPSIIDKMQRRGMHIKLSTMNDVGAGRLVVETVADVRRVVDAIVANPPDDLTLIKQKDYISNPAESGYRSHHLIYRAEEGVMGDPNFRGLTVELQVRSRLQHAWATAVETAGTYRREALKSGKGDPRWLRYFALAGTSIAEQEKTSLVPNAPSGKALASAIYQITDELRVVDRLNAYSIFERYVPNIQPKNAKYFLLELDLNEYQIAVDGFTDFAKATAAYVASERKALGNAAFDVVLVSLDSLWDLKIAYPNYFADTNAFLDAIYGPISPPSP